MRVYKSYNFFVGTKVPFDKLPGVVEEYLKGFGLTYRYFLYQFKKLDMTKTYKAIIENSDDVRDPGGYHAAEARAYLEKVNGCRRAQAENPALGEVRRHADAGRSEVLYLSNLDDPSAGARDAVVPIMNKIYRRYGIGDVMIVYHGIDFFGSDALCGVASDNGFLKKLTGARIVINRTRVFPKDTYVKVHLDVTDIADDDAADAYRDAMLGMLPAKVRVVENTYCGLSDEEEARFRELESGAKPAAGRIADAILEAVSEKVGNVGGTPGDGSVSLAPALKKAAAAYGYKYLKPYFRFYGVVKRTPRSHILYAEMETGRYGNEFNVYLELVGAGFKLRIATLSFAPSGQDEVREALFAFFEAVKTVENAELAELDGYFPESPDKYVKSLVSSPGILNL